MRKILAAALTVWSFAAYSIAADVTLTKGERTVKATIGDEAFFAYQFDVGRKKPFMLPLAAPGGPELLAAELHKPEAERSPIGTSVYVVQEDAEVLDGGSVKDHVQFGEILTATEVSESRIRVKEKNGWLRSSDVIPVLATVTRLIDDQPPQGVDRLDPRYYDHPHHKGVWFSIDEVNGIKYWNEDGRIQNQSVEIVDVKADPAVMKVVNEWVDDEGRVVLNEMTTIRIHGNRLIDYDAVLTAGDKPVTFGDTKEGMFAIRVPNSMREFAGGGPVVNAEGVQGTAACWGKPSPWIDYAGPIGSNRFGVTVMDHPSNFRPSRYHVRDYGLFSISPFGEAAYTNGAEPAAPVTLQPGQNLRLKYGLFVHGGNADLADVRRAYEQFTRVEDSSSTKASTVECSVNPSAPCRPRPSSCQTRSSRRSWRRLSSNRG